MQKFYAAEHTRQDICRRSSSGGAFTAITDSWFARYGQEAVVYGCAMDAQQRAAHIRAVTPAQRDAMTGSKYIGSDMSGVLRQAAADLERGSYVVFSGTPCQISGLKSLLKAKQIKENGRLLTVEVICHGVGSVRYFRDYLAAYEKRYQSPVAACSFRGKCRPGKSAQMTISFENGKRYESPSARCDEFSTAYSGNYILRPSCFACQYAQRQRFADISIGDYWDGSQGKIDPISLLIANSPLGQQWVESALAVMAWEEIPWERVHQPNMLSPTAKPEAYDRFWKVYRREGYAGAQRFLGNTGLRSRGKKLIARILYQTHLIEGIKKRKARSPHGG